MTDLPLFDYARQSQQSCTPRAPARQMPGSRPAEALPDDVQQVFSLLRSAVGKGRGLTAAQIAHRLGIMPDRPAARRGDYVRRLINRHKISAPFVILADPSNGFYRPAGPEDLTHFDRAIHSRIREMALNLKATRLQAAREGYQRTGRHTYSAPTTA